MACLYIETPAFSILQRLFDVMPTAAVGLARGFARQGDGGRCTFWNRELPRPRVAFILPRTLDEAGC